MTVNTRISLFLVPLFAIACSKAEKTAPPNLRPAKYAVIANGGGDAARAFPGSVQPRDATQLSFRVGGNLSKLSIKRGGKVKKGQLIASLDQADYRVALAQAQASYQSAKTSRDTAQSAFRRVEKLFEAGSSSQSDYENAKGQIKSAQAQLSAAGQQVKQARNQLQYTELRAPFDGVVNSVPVKQGEQIGAGKTVAVISKGGTLEINVGIPEGLVSRIKVGTAAKLAVSALPNGELSGSVREVGFVSENSTYPVRITLESVPAALRPGMAAEAKFDLGQRSTGLAVPTSAVGNSADGSFVYLLKDEGNGTFSAVKTNVELGDLRGEEFGLKSGLKAGDRVATAGLSNFVDGMKVRLLNPPKDEAKPAPKEGKNAPAKKDEPAKDKANAPEAKQ